MNNLDYSTTRFCWLDLAAVDARKAEAFYADLFGWQAERTRANGGEFIRLLSDGEPLASLYQLEAGQIEAGVPSHWTPYIPVSSVDETAAKAGALGGEVVVKPFHVGGVARVGLIVDSVGALVGLWERCK